MQSLQTTHAAMAPLMIGAKGGTVYDKCFQFLKNVVYPPTAHEKRKNSVFGMLMNLVPQHLRPPEWGGPEKPPTSDPQK